MRETPSRWAIPRRIVPYSQRTSRIAVCQPHLFSSVFQRIDFDPPFSEPLKLSRILHLGQPPSLILTESEDGIDTETACPDRAPFSRNSHNSERESFPY